MGNAMYRKQVTNKEYQSWTGYPDSPYLYSVFPYQTILNTYGLINLIVSVRPFYRDGSLVVDGDVFEGVYYDDVTHAWGTATDHYSARNANSIIESNHDIYTDATLTSVNFTKTTTTEQDGGSTTSLIRIRNLHHKTSVSLPTQGWTGYPSTPDGLDSYVHQCVARANQLDRIPVDTIYLFVSTGRLYDFVDPPYSALICENSFVAKTYSLVAGVWQFLADSNSGNTLLSPFYILECNTPIYSDNSFTTILYPKTTTTAQDNNETSVTFLIRDKAAFWKDGATLHRINI